MAAIAGAFLCALTFWSDEATAATIKYYENGQEISGDSLVKDIPLATRKHWASRLSRLESLAKQKGTISPWVQESIIVRSGQIPNINYPVPVLRIVFREQSFFDFNRSELKPEANPIVELISELIKVDSANPYTLIVGHTDAVGTDDQNDALAGRRATTVLRLLSKLGIDGKHLHTAPMGRRQPIAPNSTADGQARNRRVEFFIAQSYQANLTALVQLPVRSDWIAAPNSRPDSEPNQSPPPSENIDIHDADGKKSGGIAIRPPRGIRIRDF